MIALATDVPRFMRCPTLAELPPPPAGRTGWPWTEEYPQLPDKMPDGSAWPRISIVTPSFNQADFLEETIRSVLLQGYPELEYFVIDGGSKDHSVEVIKKYERWISFWVSEKDRGQSHAINKGFERCRGDLMTFQNSDDLYLPGALADAAKKFAARRDAGAVIGGFYYIDGVQMRREPVAALLPNEGPIDLVLTPQEQWRLHQVSVLYARQALDRVGRNVREDLDYVMDREVLYRVCKNYPVLLSELPYAAFRWHPGGKSISNYLKADLEYSELHLGYRYDNPADEKLKNEIAYARRAKGYVRFAKSCGAWWPAVGALIQGARCQPGLLFRRHFLATCFKVLFLGGYKKPEP